MGSLGCELEQMKHGCRIHNAQCTCAFGCQSEYRYANKNECEQALTGMITRITLLGLIIAIL